MRNLVLGSTAVPATIIAVEAALAVALLAPAVSTCASKAKSAMNISTIMVRRRNLAGHIHHLAYCTHLLHHSLHRLLGMRISAVYQPNIDHLLEYPPPE